MRFPRVSAPALALLAAAALPSLAAVPAHAAAADSLDTGLGPTTAPPWNPPRAIPASDPWEAVVRFPGRLASLPLAALGQGTRRTLLAAEQGFHVQKITYLFRGLRLPVLVGPASLGDRTGTGASVGLAPALGPARLEAFFDASTRGYTRVRARLAAGVAGLEVRVDRRPSDRFFGLGENARDAGESRYGLRQDRVLARLDLRSAEGGPGGPRESCALWAGPRWSRTTRGHRSDEPAMADVFPALAAPTLDRDVEHLTYGARLAVDHRAGRPHWSRGWRASFAAERFDRPLVESPSRAGAQFTRYQLLAEAGVSFWRDPRTLRLSFAATDNEPCSGSERFLPSDYARLGGSNGLAGYEPQRFHDLDAMNLRASYVFPLAQHFEMDVHADAGGVFPDLQHDARANRLRHSAGFALRGRTRESVVASVGLDAGPEDWRFVFSIGAEP